MLGGVFACHCRRLSQHARRVLTKTVLRKAHSMHLADLRWTGGQDIDALPRARQKFVLQTLDALLKGASS